MSQEMHPEVDEMMITAGEELEELEGQLPRFPYYRFYPYIPRVSGLYKWRYPFYPYHLIMTPLPIRLASQVLPESPLPEPADGMGM